MPNDSNNSNWKIRPFAILKEIWATLDQREKKYLKAGLWYILIFGLISTFIIPWILTIKSWSLADYTSTGSIGDTIGGVSAPFIGILSAMLTFFAFYVQYKANNLQREQFREELEKQRLDDAGREKSWKIERFENKFYELLRLHKANVNEIRVINIDATQATMARSAFVSMFYELKYTFYCCKSRQKELINSQRLEKTYSDVELLRLAYIFFYCGVGDNSDIISRSMNQNSTLKFDVVLFEDILRYLSSIKHGSKNKPDYQDEDEIVVSLNIRYQPWNGHQSHLGHYYRHLYQTVKFVAKQDRNLLSEKEKEDYLRSLRAQLSDFEQLMLYYNAIAEFSDAWIREQYFTTYRMIHNIPIPLANFGIKPQEKFEKELAEIPNLFEWLE